MTKTQTVYNIIYDEKLVQQFFEAISVPLHNDEVYWMCLANRRKYLSDDQKAVLLSGDTTMLVKRIINKADGSYFVNQLKSLEVPYGCYRGTNDAVFTGDGFVAYCNLNPSNIISATNKLMHTVTDWYTEALKTNSDHSRNNFFHINSEFSKDVQCSTSRRIWLDIDIDFACSNYIQSFALTLAQMFPQLNDAALMVFTHGGIHYVINLQKAVFDKSFNPPSIVEIITSSQDKAFFKEVKVNKALMVPIAGTYQGGYKVSMLKQSDVATRMLLQQ